jgi:hypothetical protein
MELEGSLPCSQQAFVYVFLVSSMCATCPNHFTLFDLIIVIFGHLVKSTTYDVPNYPDFLIYNLT